MGYVLGVDLGTTFTAAAVGRDGQVEMVNLGPSSTAIPSVVHLAADGAATFGEAAVRRAITEPDRVVTDYKRRMGDPVPLLVGGTPVPAHLLGARILEWVLAVVTEREGGPPDEVVVTHPANWGGYKLEYVQQLLVAAGAETAGVITEPEAAAIGYAADARTEDGEVIPVYDLGGGTFDVAILRRAGSGFELMGQPYGIEQLGGIDFDAAVYGFVVRASGLDFDALDFDDPSVATAVHQLKLDCTQAKVTLSSDTESVVPVLVPGHTAQVRLTRNEFEELIEPLIDDSVRMLERAVESSDFDVADASRILLVGGSSRIPMISQKITAALGRPVAVDADPKNLICKGAAHHAMGTLSEPAVAEAAPPSPEAVPVERPSPVVVKPVSVQPQPPAAAPAPPPPGAAAPPPAAPVAAPVGPPPKLVADGFVAVPLTRVSGPSGRAPLAVTGAQSSPAAAPAPAGFIEFDDGTTFMVDDAYVLGRDPATSPKVVAGHARPLVLVDPNASVSRVHAEIVHDASGVRIVDRGSTNGTYLWNDASNGWDRLEADHEQVLAPGMRVAVGQRTLVFENLS